MGLREDVAGSYCMYVSQGTLQAWYRHNASLGSTGARRSEQDTACAADGVQLASGWLGHCPRAQAERGLHCLWLNEAAGCPLCLSGPQSVCSSSITHVRLSRCNDGSLALRVAAADGRRGA